MTTAIESQTSVNHGAGWPRWTTSLLAILSAAVVLRLAAMLTFEGSLQDGMARISITWRWLFEGKPIFGTTLWPEGNYAIPAILLLIWNSPYWSIRIAYTVVGLTNVWLAYRLGNAVYGRAAGATAGWIVALMPLSIIVSVDLGMSEGAYVSFVLLALLAIFRYVEKPSPMLAIAAGLSLTLATTFRWDGVFWGVPLALTIAVLALQRRIAPVVATRDLTLMGLSGLLYPIVIVIQWSRLYATPFQMFAEAKHSTLQYFVDGVHRLWPAWFYQSYAVAYWPLSTFALMTPLVAALGWIGLASRLRERRVETIVLAAGFAVVWAWLAYATYIHSIQTQWRYALILSVVLAVFCSRGAEVLAARFRISIRSIVLAAFAAALAWQGLVTYVTYVDRGVLTRQLRVLSPIRPDQYSSRAMLDWMDANLPGGATVLVTPHMRDQPYLLMNLERLRRNRQVVVQGYFESRDRTHDRAELESLLIEKLSSARYVVTTTSLRELGLRDGVARELVRPTPHPDGTYGWRGIRLKFLGEFGSNRVWEVMGSRRPSGMPIQPSAMNGRRREYLVCVGPKACSRGSPMRLPSSGFGELQ